MTNVFKVLRSRFFGGIILTAIVTVQIGFPALVFAEETASPVASSTSTPAESAPLQEAAVVTGDASSDTTVQNSANSNVTTTGTDNTSSTTPPILLVTTSDATTTSSTVSDGNATSTSESSVSETSTGLATTSPDGIVVTGGNTDILSGNTATTTQDVAAAAETGGNNATASGTTTIETGNANANVNVINVVNTNIIDSSGILVLLSRLFGGTIDLTGMFLDAFSGAGIGSGATPCNLEGCAGTDTRFNVANTNGASITNDVVVRAGTGGNAATSTGAFAGIATGNANATANIVNVANTNIVKSNYLLVSVNNLGDLNGNIILPGKDFFSSLVSRMTGLVTGGSETVANTNDASVTNNVGAIADSGINTASSTSGSGIATGNAQTGVNVINQVNTNLFGGKKIYLLFRVYGNWTGKVFGVPDGVQWAETPNGVELFTSDASAAPLGLPTSATTITNTNAATITNNVQVMALTGDNQVSGAKSAIVTGNAHAAANVINIVNTNIVGENWIFAIFNIMGNWNGSLSFGQPNLWIGAAAAPGQHPAAGTSVPFTFTVKNLGNSDATHVMLNLGYDSRYLGFTDVGSTATTDGLKWDIGTVPAGQTVIISRAAVIANVIPGGSTPIPVVARVVADEPEADTSNNTDKISIVAEGVTTVDGTYVAYTQDADFVIKKQASTPAVNSGDPVEYTITLKNNGGPAYHAELFDTLTDARGHVINQETWWLETIKAGEEITVSYSMTFSSTTPSGSYINTAELKATTRNPLMNPFYGTFISSTVASSTIVVTSQSVPEARLCVPFLNSYMGPKMSNPPQEVRKLQMFLRDIEKTASLTLSGSFDQATLLAVNAFQEKYAADVLFPWGKKSPTGNVYFTTQKKINELYCQGTRQFPYSKEQLAEISIHRWSEHVKIRTGNSIPSVSGPIGKVPTQARNLATVKTVSSDAAKSIVKKSAESMTASAAAAESTAKVDGVGMLNMVKAWLLLKAESAGKVLQNPKQAMR